MQATQSDTKSWCWVALLLVILFAAPEPAAADGPTPADMQSGSLLLRTADGYVTATLLNTDVTMDISGLVARVSVRQEFTNTSGDWVEGIYVFPLPDAAAVDQMRLHIGDRFIEGEIQEKNHARKTYEKAKQAGKKTSLVEQQRANLFTTSVANIAPDEQVVVEIEYLEDVRFDEGQFSIRFPMTLTPRFVSGNALPDRQGSGWSPDTDRVPDASLISPPQVATSPAHQLSLTANVNAGVPLDIIASRYHPVSITKSDDRYRVTLAADTVPMDHDLELFWRAVPSRSPRAMSFVETVGGKPHYLLMVLPPDQAPTDATAIPREVILVIDTSGSMHGVSIRQAQQAVQLALRDLTTADRFNIIEFNSVTASLYESSQDVTPARLQEAASFVKALQANGGTEMRPALSRALDSPVSESHLRQVVFVTDGSVGYEDELFNLIETKLGTARLFTVGIGSAPNSWFMRKAAEAGRGTFTLISALHEVQEKMERLFRKLAGAQVTDIEVEWPSSVMTDSFPAVVPDLYKGEPIVVKVSASGELLENDIVQIRGQSPAGGWQAQLSMHPATDSPGVAALWARARIDELLDLERRHTEPDEVRKSIVETALNHHLVSKYTSLVAVDKTPARPVDEMLKKGQVPNLLPYGQSGNAIFAFPATASDGPLLRLTGLLILLLTTVVILLRRSAAVRARVRR